MWDVLLSPAACRSVSPRVPLESWARIQVARHRSAVSAGARESGTATASARRRSRTFGSASPRETTGRTRRAAPRRGAGPRAPRGTGRCGCRPGRARRLGRSVWSGRADPVAGDRGRLAGATPSRGRARVGRRGAASGPCSGPACRRTGPPRQRGSLPRRAGRRPCRRRSSPRRPGRRGPCPSAARPGRAASRQRWPPQDAGSARPRTRRLGRREPTHLGHHGACLGGVERDAGVNEHAVARRGHVLALRARLVAGDDHGAGRGRVFAHVPLNRTDRRRLPPCTRRRLSFSGLRHLTPGRSRGAAGSPVNPGTSCVT